MTVKFKVFASRGDWIQSPDTVLKTLSYPLPLSALFSFVGSPQAGSPLTEVRGSSASQLPLRKDQHLFLQ